MTVHISKSNRWLAAALALTATAVGVALGPKGPGEGTHDGWRRASSVALWSRAGVGAARALVSKGGAPIYD